MTNTEYNDFIKGRNRIKKALSNYKKSNDQKTAYELIRAIRNDIEDIGGITVEALYDDTVAFKKLISLAETVY